jgi:hypothetical protein
MITEYGHEECHQKEYDYGWMSGSLPKIQCFPELRKKPIFSHPLIFIHILSENTEHTTTNHDKMTKYNIVV